MLFRPEAEGEAGPGYPPPLKSPSGASDETRMFELEPALRRVIEMEGSDLHLKVPSRPLIRLHGRLEPIPGSDPLTPEDTEMVLLDLIGKDKHKLEEFTEENEVDFSFGVSGLSRFRVNAFRQRGVISLVCRAIPHEIRSI